MIKITGLNKTFDDHKALDDINMNINKGSIYGLVGTNGSGKTTIIKHLTGILKQDSGEILIDGEPVFENTELKQRIGFLPDNLNYFGSYNLKDIGKYYKNIYSRFDAERYHEITSRFNLNMKKKIHNFSKGMQKQAAFALTMSTHPDYLILDEPIDGLDPIIRKLVWKYIIDDVAERQMTVLVSSHNLREMEDICDCIGILDKGRVVIERDLDDLKSDVHKIQVAYAADSPAGNGYTVNTPLSAAEKTAENTSGEFGEINIAARDRYAGLNILHREKRGSVDLLIVREPEEKVREVIGAQCPVLFDILPLTLEEIFIYELGGGDYEISDILL